VAASASNDPGGIQRLLLSPEGSEEESDQQSEESWARYRAGPAAGTFRLMVDLPVEVAGVLDDLAQRRDVQHAEIVRLSITTMRFLDDAIADGADLLIGHSGGTIRCLVPADPAAPWLTPDAPAVPRRRRSSRIRRFEI
jgi:hypothetical protein